MADPVAAKKLTGKERGNISTEDFAFPRERKLPIHDAAHVRNALARLDETEGMTPAEKATARAKIHRAAKKFGIAVKAEGEPMQIAAMKLMAVSLDLPAVDAHPNRMPFSGILTRIDVASDKPPHGSNGKKVLLTRAAAEAGLNSLLGMGVDLTKDLDGHDAQKKVGIITAAHIEGDALNIAGFIYAADFPREALRIHLDQASLGFSFEARNLAVESMETDPLVVKSCVFTGAAILMKTDAAYETTALAAAAAKEHEQMNEEVTKAVAAALDAALGPVTKAIEAVAAAQTAQGLVIGEIQKAPSMLHAVSATVAKIEPHAKRIDDAADAMEAAGVGLHGTAGHVSHLRRMSGSMRADAAVGKVPNAYHDSGSYWAAGDRQQHTDASAVKIEETPQFKALQASFDAQAGVLKQMTDASAALETKFTDLTAKVTGMRPAPDRKTIDPAIVALLAKANLTAPDEGGTIAIGKIDAALSGIPGMDLTQRLHLKTALAKAGVIGNA